MLKSLSAPLAQMPQLRLDAGSSYTLFVYGKWMLTPVVHLFCWGKKKTKLWSPKLKSRRAAPLWRASWERRASWRRLGELLHAKPSILSEGGMYLWGSPSLFGFWLEIGMP